MRVCHITTTGVDHRYFRDLTSGLELSGHVVHLVSLGDYARPPWLREYPQVSYEACGYRQRIAFAAAVPRLASMLKRREIDICQTHLFDAGGVGMLASRLARTPARVLTRHHLDEHQILRRPIHSYLDRMMARSASCVVVPSEAAKTHMEGREGLQGCHIVAIPMGIEPRESEVARRRAPEIRRELGLQDAFVIGYTGRLTETKGLADLFEAFGHLVSGDPRLTLVLVGAETSWSRSTIPALPFANQVRPIGFRTDAPACMAAMDIAVHPSLSDSFPQVVLEAMSVGTPTIATRVGGIPEMITDGKDGLLVAPSDAHALRLAIQRLQTDSGLRAGIGQMAAETIRRQFSSQRMVDRYLRLYRELAV